MKRLPPGRRRPRGSCRSSAEEALEIEAPLLLVFAPAIREPPLGGAHGGRLGIEGREELGGSGELRELAEDVGERDPELLRIGREAQGDAELVPRADQLLLLAEGAGAPWGSMGLFGIDKVTSFHIDAPIYVSEQVWVLNPATYAKLSPAQKKVMDDHCSSDWALKIAAPWADFESGGRPLVPDTAS